MTAQEINRKSGYAIQLDEEQLRVHLESLFNELNAPTQFRVSVIWIELFRHVGD